MFRGNKPYSNPLYQQAMNFIHVFGQLSSSHLTYAPSKLVGQVTYSNSGAAVGSVGGYGFSLSSTIGWGFEPVRVVDLPEHLATMGRRIMDIFSGIRADYEPADLAGRVEKMIGAIDAVTPD